ncbi:MAG: hypothetical protein IK066_03635 [Kiritimatiellae bacterium]|nr:hypothetical protein [Kiritimatiellia bacterium]
MFDDLYAARKGKFGRFAGKVSRKADAITRWGDRWAVVTGAYGCYKAWLAHNLARGMAPEAAEKEAWLRTSAAFNETQQSNMVEYQSVFSQYGGAWSMVLQFMSSPMAISRAAYVHLDGLRRRKGSAKFHLKGLAALAMCQFMFNILSGDVFSVVKGDDDEWWRQVLKWIARQPLAMGEAVVGAALNGYIGGRLAERFLHGDLRHATADEILPFTGSLNDALDLVADMLRGDFSSARQLRRLANVVGAATATPIPGAVALASGAWDAVANPEDDLTWWQRVGRALGYSRRQVGAE